MKHKLLILLILLLTINSIAEEITDELWLKAVDLKSKSLNIYPTQSQFITVVKNKKGEVDMSENVIISHQEVDGKIINTFVEGSDLEGNLTQDSKSVKQYLSQSVLVEDVSVFKAETSEDFSLKRIGNEEIEGEDYTKYQVDMITRQNDDDMESNGYVWLDSISGIPFRLSLDVKPTKLVLKSLNITTEYSVNDSGYLITDKVVTNLLISLVFKKMYIDNTIIRDDYLKLSIKE